MKVRLHVSGDFLILTEACRCCGKALNRGGETHDGYYIHTLCVGKHWDKHSKGINKSRCREFKGR